MASIAINGLGRIGRAALKILQQAAGAEVVAVNDLVPPGNLTCLLRYDTVYGRWHTTVTADGDALVIGGRKVPVLAMRDPVGLPWKTFDVDLVLEMHGRVPRGRPEEAPVRRAGAAGMLPASTGAALAATKALPGLAGRFDGVAIRVPVPAGSIADVTAVITRSVTREEVNDAFWGEASGDRYRGILGVAGDPVVSAGIIGHPRASVVDAAMTRVVDGTLVMVMSWYDNEWGFTCQMIREAFTAPGLPAPDLSQVRP